MHCFWTFCHLVWIQNLARSLVGFLIEPLTDSAQTENSDLETWTWLPPTTCGCARCGCGSATPDLFGPSSAPGAAAHLAEDAPRSGPWIAIVRGPGSVSTPWRRPPSMKPAIHWIYSRPALVEPGSNLWQPADQPGMTDHYPAQAWQDDPERRHWQESNRRAVFPPRCLRPEKIHVNRLH